ncbi:MAG: hypothetical protein ACE364_04890 [Chlorobiota bacterium]
MNSNILTFAIFSLLFFYLTNDLLAQTFFEDAKGKTSIFLPINKNGNGLGNIRLNTADESLKIAYFHNRSDKDVFFGLDAKGKSNNGLAPLFSSEKLSPEAAINFSIGFKNLAVKQSDLSKFDLINFRIGFNGANYKIVSADTVYTKQITTQNFTGINAGVSYNYFLNGNMIFGLYGGYDKNNNLSSLSKITVNESTNLGVDSLGTTSRTTEDSYTAWKGEYKLIDQFSIYLDYVFIPNFLDNRVALSLYSRSGFNSVLNKTNAGFGIYFNEKDNPTKIIGGLIYEFEDVFDVKKSGNSLGKRGTLGIVLGYNF